MTRRNYPYLLSILIAAIYFFNNHYRSNNRYNKNNSSNYSNQHSNSNKAEEVAKQRYANGEISKEELNEILVNLK